MEMKPWIMLCLIGVLVISINPLGASAAEFFVAKTGNDSNSGTIGSPFLTLEKAAGVMSAGDTMFIRAGTYQRKAWDLAVPSGGGSWATATAIKAFNGEKVIITPQDPSQNGTDVIRLPAGKSYIIFDGLILDGLRSGTSNGGRMAFRFADGTVGGVEAVNPSHHIRISNTEMRNTYTNLILTTDAHHNEFINLKLHHSYLSYGIYMSSGDNLMQGCEIYSNGYSGTGGYGIHNYSAHTYKPNNNTYIGNKVYDNERSGIIIAQSTGVKLINNLSYKNGMGVYVGDNRYGIHIDLNVSNVTLWNNTTYGNANGELMLGPSSSNVTAQNNIFFGTTSDYTIRIYNGSEGSVITDNFIYHTNPKLLVTNLGSAMVSNNMLDQNPLFVDEKNSVFHLQPGSPAIGKGIVLKEVKYDFDNVPRGVPFDIGAYAFDLSSSLPSVSERPATPKNVQVY
jgi:parallel beta-helix repeat protein